MSSIQIRSREQLFYTLTEAAEIEHNLMCCYLYAAFTLKQDSSEGLSTEELAMVERWRRSIIHVAVEEMSHLALVSNLMVAVGGAPHFGRPNFPIAPGYHPAAVQVRLAPFNRDTLQHFIFLERPSGSDEPDGDGFASMVSYKREIGRGQPLMPSGQDYGTVGELYEAIVSGLDRLCAEHGEEKVFVGGVDRQVGPDLVGLPGLVTIGGLSEAKAAIETIVEQGEGASRAVAEGHYQAFVSIRREYDAYLTEKPDFEPARSVAHNPVMRKPVDPHDRVWVNAPDTAHVMDFANALYGQMLRLLSQAFGRAGPVSEKQILLDAAIDLMFAIMPAAEQLTLMPANDTDSCFAGMSFATLRPLTALPIGQGEQDVLAQRFQQLKDGARALEPLGERMVAASHALQKTSRVFQDSLTKQNQSAQLPQAAPIAAGSTHVSEPPPNTSNGSSIGQDGVEVVEGRALTLIFDATRCIHARHCVTGAPDTFLANVKGPWLRPDATSADRLSTIEARCPSGAIRLTRKDGGADEAAPPVNLCHIRENGPYAVRAAQTVDGISQGFRTTLCRCGQSRNKPYCDGSHATAQFEASGEPDTVSLDPIEPRGGELVVKPQQNGPLVITGALEICSGTGRVVKRTTTARLCRCGASGTKPFCDGSHARIGFKTDA